MRRALLHAIDRGAISARLFEGKQPVADTFVHPLDSVHIDDVRKYPFDTALARRQLLDEAGWTDIRDGIRHNAAGEPLRLEIMTTSGNRVRELVEQVIQSNLRDVGVDLRIRNEPARVLFRPHPAAASPVHRHGHVCLVLIAPERAAQQHAFDDDTDRGQRLVGPELHRLSDRR